MAAQALEEARAQQKYWATRVQSLEAAHYAAEEKHITDLKKKDPIFRSSSSSCFSSSSSSFSSSASSSFPTFSTSCSVLPLASPRTFDTSTIEQSEPGSEEDGEDLSHLTEAEVIAMLSKPVDGEVRETTLPPGFNYDASRHEILVEASPSQHLRQQQDNSTSDGRLDELACELQAVYCWPALSPTT